MILKLKGLDLNDWWMYSELSRVHWSEITSREELARHREHANLQLIDPDRMDNQNPSEPVYYFICKRANSSDDLHIVCNTQAFIMSDNGKTIEILR